MVRATPPDQDKRFSAVRYTNATSEDGTPQREAQLMVLLPLTKTNQFGRRELEEFRLYNELSAFLAYKHLTKRSGQVLPHLPGRLRNCDFSMTYQHHDSQYSPLRAAKELLTYYQSDNDTQRPPFAVMGAARSAVSLATSAVSAALELPQMSSSSTASALDDSPLFARTITGNAAARSMIAHLRSLGVTHAGLMFIKDSWGIAYAQNAAFYAHQMNVMLQLVPYNLEDDLDRLLAPLAQTNPLGYFVGAISSSNWKPVLRKLYDHNLIGPDSNRQWFFAEMTEVLRDGFALRQDQDLALALHGTGIITQRVNPHTAFDRALTAFNRDETLQQEFVQAHLEPDLLANFTFNAEKVGRSLFQYLTYDAVIALGITACETPGLFTGREFYDNLLQIDFEGVSGRVQLDPKTGTRTDDAFDYEVVNVVMNTPANFSDFKVFTFETTVSAVVSFPDKNVTHGLVTTLHPFVYFDNTTQAPAVLPPIEEDLNLMSKGILAIGIGLGSLVLLQSIGWALWVYINRQKQVVKAAQPIFLFQLCVGTFLTAAAIIPLSFQEPLPGLDHACKATPWLLCIGFCVAVSALLSKSTRISKLLSSGTGFRRIKVEPVDVIKPFLILMAINVVLLTAWTASPYSLSWHREPLNNYDAYGRSVESVGHCRANGNNKEYLAFVLPLVATNAVVLILAASRIYQARNLPTEFSEASYLFVTVVSVSETCLLGGTTSLSVMEHPTSFYIVVCIIICLGSMAILLPMFVPKYLRQNEQARLSVQQTIMDYNVQSTIMNKPGHSIVRDCGVPRGLSEFAADHTSTPFEPEEELPMGAIRVTNSASMALNSKASQSYGSGKYLHGNGRGQKRMSNSSQSYGSGKYSYGSGHGQKGMSNSSRRSALRA